MLARPDISVTQTMGVRSGEEEMGGQAVGAVGVVAVELAVTSSA